MSRRARRVADDEDESYFISLSDLMAGVLFLFIIMLTYWAGAAQVGRRRREP